jgi:hypothetical protein
MGSCRLLNVGLGLSAAPGPWPYAWAPLAAGLYTAVLTFVARDEVLGTPRRRGQVFVALMAGLGVGLVLFLAWRAPVPAAAVPFALVVLVGGYRLFAPLWQETTGPRIGRAVGGGILMMPALDATFVAAFGHPLAAVLVVALALPAALLRRRFAMT